MGPKKFILENFLTNFGLKKNFQKFFKFFCLKRFTKDGSLTSPSDRPMHAAIWHIRVLLIFWKIEKKFFSKIFLKLWVCAVWVHILGVPARGHELQHHTSNIFRSHPNRLSRSKVMHIWKLGPIWVILVPIFKGNFWRALLWGFTAKSQFWSKPVVGPIFGRP